VCIALHRKLSQSYGVSPCGIPPSTQNKWTHPSLTPARQAGTRFTYPGGMEGWVDLGGWWCYTYALYLQQRSQCQVWDICSECRRLWWAYLPWRWFHDGDWYAGQGDSCSSIRVIWTASNNTEFAAELSRCKPHWHILLRFSICVLRVHIFTCSSTSAVFCAVCISLCVKIYEDVFYVFRIPINLLAACFCIIRHVFGRYVLVCSSGAINSPDWATLSTRKRRSHHSGVNSDSKCQSTADFAIQLKNLPNRHSAGNI